MVADFGDYYSMQRYLSRFEEYFQCFFKLFAVADLKKLNKAVLVNEYLFLKRKIHRALFKYAVC